MPDAPPTDYPDDLVDELVRRLRRVEGQVRGIAAMLEDGRGCRDVVTQIAAATKALEQVGFKLVASGLSTCLQAPGAGRAGGPEVEEFERLFLKLA
jgi:DNA-binding FrmR family transcriptional regulator